MVPRIGLFIGVALSLALEGCGQPAVTYQPQPPASDLNASAQADDYQPAYRLLLERAARDPEALGFAGFFNLIGAGTPQNPNIGIQMLQEAANRGASSGYFGLGFAFAYGLGTQVNLQEAARYYSVVVGLLCRDSGGPKVSIDRLADAESKIRGICRTPIDQRAGLSEYQSIETSLPIVSVVLGRLYDQGIGTQRDPQKAQAYFQKAAADGMYFAGAPNDTSVAAGDEPDSAAGSNENSPDSSGTAFAISPDGLYLTNYHVVQGCSELRLNSVSASFLRFDEPDDLALVKTTFRSPTIAALRESTDGRAGETVIAVGFPYAGLLADQANVTTGTISATAGLGNDQRYLQITAPVQPGNSGGPLLDMNGLVVGIVAAKLDAIKIAAATGDIPENVNFSIKASVIRSFLDSSQVATSAAPEQKKLDVADIAAAARKFTYLVECWN